MQYVDNLKIIKYVNVTDHAEGKDHFVDCLPIAEKKDFSICLSY